MTREHVGLRGLRAAYDRFVHLEPPVPEGDDDELDDLFGELELFEVHAAGLISSIAAAAPIWPNRLERDDDLFERIAARARTGDPVDVADARRLLAYLESLHALIDLARVTHERTRPAREPRGTQRS